MRLQNRLIQTFGLSPEAGGFFYATVLAHVALKVLLGLTLAFDDGYGLRSLMAPPQSLVFAGGDVLSCFVAARLLQALVPVARQRLVQAGCLLFELVFLTTNFVIHSYFKSFVNRGLLEFNGASAVELADYTRAAITPYSLAFVSITVCVFVGYVARFDVLMRSRLFQRRFAALGLVAPGAAALGFVGTLNQGQSGFLSQNPEYQLLQSYARAQATATLSATAEEAQAFRDPRQPLHGSYLHDGAVSLPSQHGRNVLFVLIESLPFEQTSLAGEAGLPVLHELAQHGVSFDNFRTVFPGTSRSFMTYHCGIYPSAGPATATKYRPGYHCDSILDGLKAAGYRTGFFTAPMFTYDNMHKARFMRGYDAYQDFLSLRAHARRSGVNAPAVEEEVVADALMSFIDEDRSQPFFATYFMFWDHAPYRLPFEDISGLKPLDRYHRTLAYLDDVLRSVLARLKKSGVLDETVVIVAADHGEGFALHHDNTNHCGHLYEDDVRIPFVIHVPGEVGAQQSHRQSSNVDFAPTLFALLGLPRAGSWEGQDLLGQDFMPRPTLLFGRAAHTANAVVDGNLKYIEYPDNERQALYDLATDPHEQHDLLAQRAEEAQVYRTLLSRWLPVVEWRSWAVSDDTRSTGAHASWLKSVGNQLAKRAADKAQNDTP